ncbi:unnamed protein product [Cylindrotheca closterium]|uniref:Uncharacterized protein n=1 Tax=Cylindrotheca closterium TaxID=2856 RepID=A0AAD2FF31_9STRA|nr:unnamed protein product [Cylindrotheca closterium]
MKSINLISALLLPSLSMGSSRVMVTQYSDLLHWTCFSALLSTDCCRDIEIAGFDLGLPNPYNCEHLIAEIPDVPVLHDHGMAKFSLVLQNHNKTDDSVFESGLQHRWEDSTWKKQDSPTLPFFWGDIKKVDQSARLRSTLSQEGGMHRQMTSSLEKVQDFESYFIIMTVPQSMFVDLDDFLIDDMNSILHATKVCDIEKPEFVSGQHVIIVEGQGDDSTFIRHTKWHVRYPKPGQAGIALIENLLEPSVVFVKDGALYHHQQLAKLPHVSVATGYEKDGDFVMWATIVACCVGVWKMLQDLSIVSYWDP